MLELVNLLDQEGWKCHLHEAFRSNFILLWPWLLTSWPKSWSFTLFSVNHLCLFAAFTFMKIGLAPSYHADELHHPAESEFRRHLRSASSHELSIPRTRLTTYGVRALPVAAIRIWILEQSSAAYHICCVTSCLLLSLEDILLRTLLSVITVVVPAKWHCHLWTR